MGSILSNKYIEGTLWNKQAQCGMEKRISLAILERLNRYEKYRGDEITMEQIIQRQAQEMAAWIDTGKKYKPYIAKW